MADILKEAWELLEVGERPEGMSSSGNSTRRWLGVTWYGEWFITDAAAYDRICQAVEGVLLKAGMYHECHGGEHVWWRDGFPLVSRNPERLTAAVAALGVERSKP